MSPTQLDPVAVRRARIAVASARKRGRLVTPACCSACHEPNALILAHHEDYARPLDVAWLCTGCHMERHRQLGWGLPHSRRLKSEAA